MAKTMIKRRGRKIRRRYYNDVGRESKFTRARRKIIYEALEGRLPMIRACQLATVSYGTFRKWIKEGRDENNIIYHRFRSRVKGIQATHEMEALDVIHKAQRGDIPIIETKTVTGPRGSEVTRIKKKVPHYQAAVWYLERVAKNIYGRNAILEEMQLQRSELKVSGRIEHDHQHNHQIRAEIEALKTLPRETLEQLADIRRGLKSPDSLIPAGTGRTEPVAGSEAGGNGSGGEVSQPLH